MSNLSLIVPHFKAFVKDQAANIKSYVKEVIVLMPMPFFSSVVLNFPYMEGILDFCGLP